MADGSEISSGMRLTVRRVAFWVALVGTLLRKNTNLPIEVEVPIILLTWTLWLAVGFIWAQYLFGTATVPILLGLGLALAGLAGYAYWQDQPDREVVDRIMDLHALDVKTEGGWLTGHVVVVYFDSKASNADIEQFIQLEGLGGLKRLMFTGTRLTDATARKLDRFPELTQLYLDGTGVSPEAIEHLKSRLPDCKIQLGRSRPAVNVSPKTRAHR